nr:MAG TPA: hypothetical protein [Caudoviricetes sp.]
MVKPFLIISSYSIAYPDYSQPLLISKFINLLKAT